MSENRKQRQTMKRLQENMERASEMIIKLRRDKATLEETDKSNFAKTKKLVDKLKADIQEKTKALEMAEAEVGVCE